MKIKTVIVDDEPFAREALKNYIGEYCPDLLITGMAGDVDSALELINDVRPDLVFLDIQMPNPNEGFILLDRLQAINFKIIFVTAHSQYAQKAFRYFAVDYLLKPLNITELIEAVGRAKLDITNKSSNENLMALRKHDHIREGDFEVLILRENSGFRTIMVKDIIMCEAEGTYTRFHMVGGSKEMASKNLKHYQEILEQPPFIRVQNSYLINFKHVRKYQHSDRTIYLSENLSAPLGDSYRENFMTFFK